MWRQQIEITESGDTILLFQWSLVLNQSIFYLNTHRPGARKPVQNTNVDYNILNGKIYIDYIKKFSYNYKSKNCTYIKNI